jgi:3-oxoacyl-[acyl-carrier-protein] synthase-1
MQRVVVTGMGLVNCLGESLDAVSEGLRRGRSQVVLCEKRKSLGFRSGLVTRLPKLDYRAELDRKARKFMPEAALYTACATNRALKDAGLSREEIRRPDVGIVVGNDSSCEQIPDLVRIMEETHDTHYLGSAAVIKVMNSTVSMNLGPYLGATGVNLTISAACSSGAHAIGHAYHLLRSGAQRMIFAGGAQEDTWLGAATFDAINAFSIREHDPVGAVRPFDKDRDGLVPSGGGAMLVLETLESARERGARIHGEVVGYGFSSDGDHLTVPTGDGALRCMRAALESAGLEPQDVDYINAHATGTIEGDRVEAIAIREAFGENGPPVSSTKAITGHECWMAGASEAIYCLLMMRDGFLAPNINFTGFDEGTPPIRLVRETMPGGPDIALTNSFGFGGTNACLVLRRPQE